MSARPTSGDGGPGFVRLAGKELRWLPALKEIYKHESNVLSRPGAWRTDIEEVLWSLDDVLKGRQPSAEERQSYADLVDWLVERRLAMKVPGPNGGARYVTRVGETVRLLGHTHEYWHAGRAAIEAIRWVVEDKRVPMRSISESAFEERLLKAIEEGVRPDWRKHVEGAAKQAIAGVSSVLGGAQGESRRAVGFSEFQLVAATEMILSEFGSGREAPAQVITAGVGSGKTYAFMIPTLVSALASLRRGDDKERRTTILVYPRKALAYDQYQGLVAVKTNLGATALKVHFDHNSEYKRLGYASVGKGVESIYGGQEPAPHIIVTTLETLKRRLFNPAFMGSVPRTLRRVVVDEIHLVEGLGGAHAVRILDRLRAACETQRPKDSLLWTAASATIAQPHVHAATVFGLRQSQVAVIEPKEGETETVGLVHHVFLRPTGEISTLGTLVNATSILIHNRRGRLSNRNERKADQNPKTIAFADNLDMLGRWNSDFKENERTEQVSERKHATTADPNGWKPRQREVPYAARFSRPLQARIDAHLPGEAPGLHAVLQDLKDERLCERCQKGELVDKGPRSQEELSQLSELVYRRPLKDDDKIEAFKIVNPKVFESGSQKVGTLNLCPYLRAGACFWFADETCRSAPIPHTDPQEFEWAEVVRSKVHSSKTTSDDELGGELEDVVFRAPVADVYDTGDRVKEVAVDVVMASPSLEVGIDLSNLTESIMFHAIRNVASYRQKAGRIGRERGSDSINISLMANRPIDLHYYRQPRKLVSLAQLDPIPLKANNSSVLRNALYTATWDWLALRTPIPEFVTAAKSADGGWDFTARLGRSLQELKGRMEEVGQHLTAVSRNVLAPDSPEVTESIKQVESELEFLLRDVSTEFVHAGRLSDLVPSLFAGTRVYPAKEASKLLDRINVHADYYRALRPDVVPVQLGLVDEFASLDMMLECGWSLDILSETLASLERRAGTGPPDQALNDAIEPLRKIKAALEGWGRDPLPLYFHRQLDRLFGSTGRTWETHYLSYLIEDLDVFRLLKKEKEYVRMKDLYSNPYENEVDLEGAVRDKVRLSEALFSLIPGTWTYRFGRSAKTKSGDLIGRNGVLRARFSELKKVGSFEAIRTEVPGPPGLEPGFDVFRPTRLTLYSQRERDSGLPSKYLRFDPANGVVIDGDEGHGGRERDEKGRYPPVKIPKSYLNRWVHVEAGQGRPVRVMEQEKEPERLVLMDAEGKVSAKSSEAKDAIHHPLAKSLLSGVLFHDKLEVIEYVYSVSRTYTNKQVSGVEIVFEGPTGRPMAFGGKMETEGISIELKPSNVTAVRDRVVEGMRKGDPRWAPTALKSFGSYLTACGLNGESRASPFLTRDLLSIVAIATAKKGGPWSTGALSDSLRQLDADPDLLRRTALEYYSKSLDEEAADEESVAEPGKWTAYAETRANQLSAIVPSMAAKVDGLNDCLGPWVTHTILNSFATAAMNALQRLAGVTDIAVGSSVDFESTKKGEFRIFLYDRDVHGNGSSEVARRFLHTLHIQRHGEDESSRLLPSDDFYAALEEELLQCPQYHTDSDALAMLSQKEDGGRPGMPMLGYVKDSASEVLANAKDTWRDLRIAGRSDMWMLPILRQQVAAIAAERGLEVDDLVRATTVCWNGCPECLLNSETQSMGITGEMMLDKAVLDEWFREGRSSSDEYFVLKPEELAAGASKVPYGRLSAVALNLDRKRVRSVTLPHAIGIELGRMEEEPRIIVRDSDIEGMHLFDAPANLPALGIQTLGFKRLFWHDLVMTAFLDMMGLIEDKRRSVSAVFLDARDVDFEDVGISDRMLAAIAQRRDERGAFEVPERLSDILVWLSRRGYDVSICVDKGNAGEAKVRRFLTILKEGGCKVYVKDLGTALMHGKAIRTPLGVVFGSANLSMRGTLTNEEIVNYAPYGNVGYSQLATTVNDIFYGAELF
ncbi:MAG: DEAD/DEAH box helicase [Nitrososphaerales archaeon]